MINHEENLIDSVFSPLIVPPTIILPITKISLVL